MSTEMKINTIEDSKSVKLKSLLWFGKYKGKKISEVPNEYVGWCIAKEIFTLGKKRDEHYLKCYRRQGSFKQTYYDYAQDDWGDDHYWHEAGEAMGGPFF